MRDYEKEKEWEQSKYFRFHCKLNKDYEEIFKKVKRADFLRWCVENNIVDRYLNEKEKQ